MDFGCGTGELLESLTQESELHKDELELTLLDPVESYRLQAQHRLQRFSKIPIQAIHSLNENLGKKFDIIISNHVLYYVPDLKETIDKLLSVVASDSTKILITMASKSNELIQYWMSQFPALGHEVPYHLQTAFENELASRKSLYEKIEIRSELEFNDSSENRLKMARFLLGKYFNDSKNKSPIEYFDKHSKNSRVHMSLIDHLFVIHSNERSK